MATHSSVLAWEIPGIEEPGGVQSKGSPEADTTQQLDKQTNKKRIECKNKSFQLYRGKDDIKSNMLLLSRRNSL